MSRGLRLPSTFAAASLLLTVALLRVLSAADKPPVRDDSKVEITPRAKKGDAPPDTVRRGNIRVESTLVLIPVTMSSLSSGISGMMRNAASMKSCIRSTSCAGDNTGAAFFVSGRTLFW